MRGLDFTSLHSIFTGLAGLALITLIGMGVRLVMMMTIQQRRERQNRQINERLRTLIAAYKTLGGSFTGDLSVDPRHLRDIRRTSAVAEAAEVAQAAEVAESNDSDRPRRIRDAVEAALADIILLGTEEQVRLAAQAAQDMVAGRVVLVGPLVASLRAFIREALDLAPMPADLVVPPQGPARPSASGGGARGAGAGQGGAGAGRGGGGGGGGGGGAMAGGAGMGMGLGTGLRTGAGEEPGGVQAGGG